MNFRRTIILTLLILSITSLSAYSQVHFISVGLHSAKYSGNGSAGDAFDFGPGGSFELGVMYPSNFCWVYWGGNYYESVNKMNKSEVTASFMTLYYTELRVYSKARSMRYFFLMGYDLNKMKFEGHKGYDTQHLLSIGMGLQFKLGKKSFLHIKAKPFFVWSNDLGQDNGLSLQASLGSFFR